MYDIHIYTLLIVIGISSFLVLLMSKRNLLAGAFTSIIMGVGLFGYFVNVDNLDIELGSVDIESNVTTVWNQQLITGQNTIHNGTGNNVIRAEHITASNSLLYGHTVNCMEIAIGKTGSPPITTEVVLGVFSTTVSGSIAETKYEFGRVNVTNITIDKMFFKRCNEISSYTLIVGDRIGIMYRAGDASNLITWNENNQNPFDGTITAISNFNDATNTWSGVSGSDVAQITLTLESDAIAVDNILKQDVGLTTNEGAQTKLFLLALSFGFIGLGAIEIITLRGKDEY